MKKVAFVDGLVFVHDNLNEKVEPCHEALDLDVCLHLHMCVCVCACVHACVHACFCRCARCVRVHKVVQNKLVIIVYGTKPLPPCQTPQLVQQS